MEQMQSIFNSLGNQFQKYLPLSPFREAIQEFDVFGLNVGWLNWVIPVQDIVKVTLVWLGAIATFYVFQIILRWLKVIE